jgi:hypothetical protein
MPREPDYACKIINASNGYIRGNSSWIIGRIARDFEYWRDSRITKRKSEVVHDKWMHFKRLDAAADRPRQASLIISIYEPSKLVPAGTVKLNSTYRTAIFIVILQLVIAAIPLYIYRDWGIITVTAAGTVLAFATGLLPQWNTEKWACRKNARTTYIITRGNGAQHAIMILGNGHGLNLEDLASGQSNTEVATNTLTRLAIFALATLWILLLITAAGIKSNTWFLLAVGSIGLIQNIYVAGHHCRPENFGLPLDFVRVIGQRKVMDTLLEAERSYEYLGRALLPEFFPGTLTAEDEARWERIKATDAQTSDVAVETSLPHLQQSRRQSV